jgi:hypothetical protein
MMLFATVRAYEAGEIKGVDWSLVDHEFLMRLLRSETKDIRDTVQRWIAGDLWGCTPLRWMTGDRPDYPRLLAFSRDLGEAFGRPCLAYGIRDKRERRLVITFDDGSRQVYGENARQWLLGIGSRKRSFRAKEVEKAFDLACSTFATEVLGPVARSAAEKDAQPCLL